MRKKIKVLGVNFDKTTEKEALGKIEKWLSEKSKKKHFIVTPNPEIVLKAQKDSAYMKIINSADMSIADGIGILWASKYKRLASQHNSKVKKVAQWLVSLLIIPVDQKYIKTELPERITGVDLMKKICRLAADKRKKVYLLGADEGVAEKTAAKLQKLYPTLKIVGTYAGRPTKSQEDKIVKKIRDAKTEILFVAYGAPSQEKWIHRNMHKIPTLKVVAGIGGAFDFISGKTPRAPKKFRRYGLEWAYRLYKEPRRIKRIFNATVKFPFKILMKK
jgi:N-acetylglucosaminyldiphosphoundecaprenol N-acetyl-beta-D-mannosaminyltransferase